MSNWYKKATLNNDLTNIIVTWLRNTKNAIDSASANDDVSHQMQGADNQILLMNAINAASSIVMQEQGGILSPTQQELIQILNNRTQDFEQATDPFQMPQTPQMDQGLESQFSQDPTQNNNGW